MEIIVRNAEGSLSAKDRDYAQQKINKLNKYFHQANRVEMVHRENKVDHHHSHRIEITVFADGYTIRGEENDSSITAAIDKVAHKLETRLTRLKGRIVDSYRKKGKNATTNLSAIDESSTVEDTSNKTEIKVTKQIFLEPMSYDEAALQLEMVGHPFYMFRNERSGQVEVLYRRNDGHYGLIQAES